MRIYIYISYFMMILYLTFPLQSIAMDALRYKQLAASKEQQAHYH